MRQEKDRLDNLKGTQEARKDQLDSLRDTREAGKNPSDKQRGTREAPYCARSIDWPLKCRSEHRIAFDREATGRRRGGNREARKDHLDRLKGTREAGKINWTACEAPERQERIHRTACEAPKRQERTICTAWEAPVQLQWRTARFLGWAVGCPQHRLASNRPLGAPVAQNCLSTTACSTESSLKGLRSANSGSTP